MFFTSIGHIFRIPKGGRQEVIRQICSATAAYGVESRILTLSPNPVLPVLQRDEAEVLRYPYAFGDRLFGLFREGDERFS